MSRLCVKNLPKNVNEKRLREFFSQKGEVTDAKIMRTKDGNSRQFGFVGYRTEGEAEEAVKYFNNSYLDTSRVVCEIARKVGDPNIPRPWSRYSLQKQENLDEGKKVDSKSGGLGSPIGGKKKSKKGKVDDDPQLQEFLQVMQLRVKSKLWGNDSLTTHVHEQNKKSGNQNTQLKGKETVASVLAQLDDSEKSEPRSLDSQGAEKSSNLAFGEVISDMDYFKSRVKKEWSDSEKSDDEDNSDNSGKDGGKSKLLKMRREHQDIQKVDPKVQRNALETEASEEEVEEGFSEDPEHEVIDTKKDVLETGRLFVRNLPYTATEDELEEHFRKLGNVSQVHLVIDKDTKRSKGIAYVVYTLPESAARALDELDNSIFQGRLLHVMPAKQKHNSEKQESNAFANESLKTFKQKKQKERKSLEASGNTQAWNSLFMHPDTVVENIAREFGISKSDVLDREADDLPVRIALGETKVIAETKKALVNAGVNIASLEELTIGKTDGVKRSDHVILVKNLPYGCSEDELDKMFRKFGSLDKIILPRTRTLALVVFLEPSEARAAFKAKAYKCFKGTPLYLEWAPGDILSQNSKILENTNNAVIVGEHQARRVLLEQHVEGIVDADVDPDRIESRSLYVKNLNFKTSDASLGKHFSELMKEGKVLSARVKKHSKNGKNVSMGFGFLEFDCVETAVTVCKDLQGTVLDGHALSLQLCHAKNDGKVLKSVDKSLSSTKLFVRNVAFEATEKDLRQLFSPFGEIKRIRLPRRIGHHGGFAFVEFGTKQEANNAIQALSSTHLYGRHLVLERAKERESLEDLRAKTAAQFSDRQDGMSSTKISKKRNPMAVLDESNVKFRRIAD
ncbi:multiple RNA-binding domain-containing protein 1 isoform X2 [Rhododendron vialii]|nr:multiple RNA-binding domain-containing protein 1 isoform X2 [Rhododendron vialii]